MIAMMMGLSRKENSMIYVNGLIRFMNRFCHGDEIVNSKLGVMIMKRETAEKIVKNFFNQMNPDMWSGNGNRPISFDDRAWQYPLTNEVNLELTFVNNEEDGWCHYCDLVYESDNVSFDMLSGYGIDSVQNIIDTVLDLCRDYEL